MTAHKPSYNKQHIILIVSIIAIIILDQLTKYVFYDIALRQDSIFLHPVLNTWIARSIPLNGTLVIVVSFLALWLFGYLHTKKELTRYTTALLIGGTIGNLMDRLLYEGVRDMFVTPRYIYNVADVALNLAIIIIIILSLKEWLEKGTRNNT